MKKTILLKATYVVLFLLSTISYSQNLKPFSPRYQALVRGDITMIGNNILNRNSGTDVPTVAYDGTGLNSDFDMQYIDIDSDVNTFSSSSATLSFPTLSCNKIIYAGLYWSAVLQSGARTDINKVKLQLPTGSYNDIVGQVIYDANTTPIGASGSKPYACYANVTTLLTGLTNPEGTYTLANVLSSQGSLGSSGLSAGWTLFIVYENPTIVRKFITSFDGFTALSTATNSDTPMAGIITNPYGPVKVKFAMAALEGDQSLTGDYLRINSNTISTPQRPATNFFNSSLTNPTGYFTNRAPNGSNTLGLDTAIINIPNPANAVIANYATFATIRLGNNSDHYNYFFNAFAIDFVEPNIVLTANVVDNLGIPVTGADVSLGQDVNYNIGFQNIGNDNAISFTIRTHIPTGVIVNSSDLIFPPGVTYIYNPATREYVFTIPNSLVEVGDPRYEILIKESIPTTCENFANACSNVIENQAFASYTGAYNPILHSDEGSILSFDNCGVGTAGASIFKVSLNTCDFTKNEIICGSTLNLQAAYGYQSYIWSGPGTITPDASSNGQNVVVSEPGIYTVNDVTSAPGCVSILETFNVSACTSSDLVFLDGNKLASRVTNASTYQWIDCDNGNQPIAGENNQSFEPLSSGNYALLITMPDGYGITSNCVAFSFLGTETFEKLDLKLYPNPTKNQFSIAGDVVIEKLSIYNLLGQKIAEYKGNVREYAVNQLESGTYIVKIETEKGTVATRIIKN